MGLPSSSSGHARVRQAVSLDHHNFFEALHHLHIKQKNSPLYRAILSHGDFDPIGADEPEDVFLSRVQAYAVDIARGIYQRVASLIERLDWTVILSTDTIPLFVKNIWTQANTMLTATGVSLGDAIRSIAAASSQFWGYVRMLFASPIDDEQLSESELEDVQELESGMTWMRSVIRMLGTWTSSVLARAILSVATATKSLVERAMERVAGTSATLIDTLINIPQGAVTGMRKAHRATVKYVFFSLSGIATLQEMFGVGANIVADRLEKYVSALDKQLGVVLEWIRRLNPVPALATMWSTLLETPIIGKILRTFGYGLSMLNAGITFILDKLRWVSMIYRVFTAPYHLLSGYLLQAIPTFTSIFERIVHEWLAPGYGGSPMNNLLKLMPIATQLSQDRDSVPSATDRNRLEDIVEQTQTFLDIIQKHKQTYYQSMFQGRISRMFQGPMLSAEMLTRAYFGEDPSQTDLDTITQLQTGMTLDTFQDRLMTLYAGLLGELMTVIVAGNEEDEDEAFARLYLSTTKEENMREALSTNAEVSGFLSWLRGDGWSGDGGGDKRDERTLDDVYREIMGLDEEETGLPATIDGLEKALVLVQTELDKTQDKIRVLRKFFSKQIEQGLALTKQQASDLSDSLLAASTFREHELLALQEQLSKLQEETEVDLLRLTRAIPARLVNRENYILARKSAAMAFLVAMSGLFSLAASAYYWYSSEGIRSKEQYQAYERAATLMSGGRATDPVGNILWSEFMLQERANGFQVQSTPMDPMFLGRFQKYWATEMANSQRVSGAGATTTNPKAYALSMFQRWGNALIGTPMAERPDFKVDRLFAEERQGKGKSSSFWSWFRGSGKKKEEDGPTLTPEQQADNIYIQYVFDVQSHLQKSAQNMDRRIREVDAPPTFAGSVYVKANTWWSDVTKKVRMEDLNLRKGVEKFFSADYEWLSNVIEFFKVAAYLLSGVIGTAIFAVVLIATVSVDVYYEHRYTNLNELAQLGLLVMTTLGGIWAPVADQILTSVKVIKENRMSALLSILGPIATIMNMMSLLAGGWGLIASILSKGAAAIYGFVARKRIEMGKQRKAEESIIEDIKLRREEELRREMLEKEQEKIRQQIRQNTEKMMDEQRQKKEILALPAPSPPPKATIPIPSRKSIPIPRRRRKKE